MALQAKLIGDVAVLESPPGTPPPDSKMDQLEAALRAIVKNAVEYNAPGGTVTFSD